MDNQWIQTKQGIWRCLKAEKALFSDTSINLFDALMEKSRLARANAYAPYSGFSVGAAVLMDGEIHTGTNVENASYGATVCAERSAIFSAAGLGAREISAIAISTSAEPGSPPENRSPCGMCRQVIGEFANADTFLLLDSGSNESSQFVGEVILFEDLFPLRFRLGS